jgi:hypothetical protein
MCKQLLVQDGRREFTVLVPETNPETVDTGDLHLHSEYQVIKTGKYKAQVPNIRRSNTRRMRANHMTRDGRLVYIVHGAATFR